MFDFFANIFGYILNFIYQLVNNYGLAIIIFSILIKIAMLPLSISQQKTLKKNEKIQEKMKILQVKHKGNPEKLNQEMMELYKSEKINPFSGCFNVIIQMILIISMFMLVKSPITYMKKVKNEDKDIISERISTIEKETGESSISKTYPEISIIKYLQENDMKDDEMYINMDFLGLNLSKVPQENYSDPTVYIIPVLYVVSSFISIKMTSAMTTKKEVKSNEDGKDLIKKEDANEMSQAEMAQQMNKSMTWMMPVLSVSISLVAPLGLALYWLVNNIIMIVERIIMDKVFSKKEEENV